MKIDQCDRCQFYSHQLYFICGVHPAGVDSDKCLDFRQNAEEEELWISEEGYSWYDGELIPNTPPRYTPEEQLYLLDNHPFFTGKCPKCGHQFDRNNLPAVHWDCPQCGWVDDSV